MKPTGTSASLADESSSATSPSRRVQWLIAGVAALASLVFVGVSFSKSTLWRGTVEVTTEVRPAACQSGEPVEFSIEITNGTRQAVRIENVVSDCGCFRVMGELPMEISPRDSLPVRVLTSCPGEADDPNKTFTVLVSTDRLESHGVTVFLQCDSVPTDVQSGQDSNLLQEPTPAAFVPTADESVEVSDAATRQ